jgi:3-hydroxyacyl-[acyl-carrier-protein] dehydratase
MMADTPVDPDILQRLKTIIRRDLKLGPQARVDDDMPFFASEADLDSLDILLLVTSVEKEFGIRIPSAEVGRSVFESPLSLARYIQHRRAATGPASPASPAPAEASLLDRLPHREPFRFVTRVTRVESGQSAEGAWSVSGDEAFFAGHFPGRPIVPGVLITEALAQLAGLAAASQDARSTHGSLVYVDVRFEKPVIPPADILLSARLTREMGAIRQFDVAARAGEKIVARGTLALHLEQRPA